jgi:tRNA-dihydrouridine synthase B
MPLLYNQNLKSKREFWKGNMRIYPENSLILAPLSGHTDMPYRNSARRMGCVYAFTEMIDAGSLVFGNEKTLRFLDRAPGEKWLGAQLVGSEPEILSKAVEILNKHNFSVLDFNLGCPAPKVAKKGEGAALGKDFDRALKAFNTIKKASTIPVTAKIRILDENDPAPTIKLAKALENAGAEAVTVHGRIMKSFYSGPVFHEIISAVRAELKIQTVGNGGVMGHPDYCEMKEKTGCDAIMLARGAMGNPWIFRELSSFEEYVPPSASELAAEIAKHIHEMINYYGETLAMKVSRKVILDYMRGRGFPGELKKKVSFLSTKNELDKFIDEIRQGPSYRYWTWLKGYDYAERRLRSND